MQFSISNYLKTIVAILMAAMVFSCKNNFKAIKKIGLLENKPIGEAQHINLNYTEYLDSTVRLKANLKSPMVLDFSNRPFAFNEFPNGIQLIIYSEEGHATKIFADYAISYSDTKLIDLQGNVIVATHEKDTLFTEQLYYNQNLEWLFTNEPFFHKKTTSFTKGTGFNSDKSFKNFSILDMSGEVAFEE